MKHAFGKEYWETHWEQVTVGREIGPNPHLARETRELIPGTALDAGCGEGAEAIWLAANGWQVTAADISAEALSRASERARQHGVAPERLRWVEADLTTWKPDEDFDLVTTIYAHPAMPHAAFYRRISHWVAPGGTLLIVGHLHTPSTTGRQEHGHHSPEEASVTAAGITAQFDATEWDIVTAEELTRSLANRAGQITGLHDVVVRAIRRR